ncbi:Crp/Fnr family transcriptional regulator [Fulvivirgaceae bacterium LMO-SS25]
MEEKQQSLLKHNIERTIGYKVSDEDFSIIWKHVFIKSFNKKTILAEEGQFCKYVYFILKGSAYSYLINEKGEKNVIQFALEGYWITDHYSFFSGQSGIYTIETLEDSEILVINKESYEAICKESHLLEHFFRILIQNAFINLQYRLAKTNSEEARKRYLEFSKKYPHFIQRIPQYLIATYLGIKPQSLSRIRKELISQK